MSLVSEPDLGMPIEEEEDDDKTIRRSSSNMLEHLRMDSFEEAKYSTLPERGARDHKGTEYISSNKRSTISDHYRAF